MIGRDRGRYICSLVEEPLFHSANCTTVNEGNGRERHLQNTKVQLQRSCHQSCATITSQLLTANGNGTPHFDIRTFNLKLGHLE